MLLYIYTTEYCEVVKKNYLYVAAGNTTPNMCEPEKENCILVYK